MGPVVDGTEAYLGESGVRERLEKEFAFFAGLVVQLALVNSGGGDRGYGHAISQEEYHIFRFIFIQRQSDFVVQRV